ncbi:hypothetical protein NDU88_009549 [Pleurodeles waltl]|uniref:Uncharacterized protein n=1 Tax=Pleurodeles waltl TaxID=8319 RepID=A0AAV7PZQ6_PLEWA|nr:hypothetical protein NDU88_009549 [Pleurodeles waltl]
MELSALRCDGDAWNDVTICIKIWAPVWERLVSVVLLEEVVAEVEVAEEEEKVLEEAEMVLAEEMEFRQELIHFTLRLQCDTAAEKYSNLEDVEKVLNVDRLVDGDCRQRLDVSIDLDLPQHLVSTGSRRRVLWRPHSRGAPQHQIRHAR